MLWRFAIRVIPMIKLPQRQSIISNVDPQLDAFLGWNPREFVQSLWFQKICLYINLVNDIFFILYIEGWTWWSNGWSQSSCRSLSTWMVLWFYDFILICSSLPLSSSFETMGQLLYKDTLLREGHRCSLCGHQYHKERIDKYLIPGHTSSALGTFQFWGSKVSRRVPQLL